MQKKMIVNESDQQQLSYIPAGSYRIGSNSGYPDEHPRHEVLISAFYLGVYEISNLQFADFLNDVQPKRSKVDQWIGIQNRIPKSSMIAFTGSRYRTQYGYEDHPVIGVSYKGAKQYCHWAQLRLPTEAEWEIAAQGGDPGAIYPWGDEAPEGRANYGQLWINPNTAPPTTTVGSFPANFFGLYDLAGNALEWTSSPYFPYEAENLPEDQRASLEGRKVLRGGGFDSSEEEIRIHYRRNYQTSVRSYYTGGIGFRCAKTEAPL